MPPRPLYPLERGTLGNGLRVVVAPDRRVPVVAVAVCYDVGSRTEPEGRAGFAHLFEHVMFTGSRHVSSGGHFRSVQSAGGDCNAFTRTDHTVYFNVLPSNGLERALFLEADRMAAPTLTAAGLAAQRAVVEEEMREWVLNVPGGTFPDFALPPLLFSTYPNVHNGFSEFADLTAASVEDCRAFFHRFYTPRNAVLAVAGDTDPETVLRLADRYFGPIPSGRRPRHPSLAEPNLTAEHRGRQVDPRVARPSIGIAWRVPDPRGQPQRISGLRRARTGAG